MTGLRKFHFFFLNIKPYNLCKKRYVTYKSIYIFIYSTSEAYVQFILTETRRKETGKKAPNRTSCLILWCRHRRTSALFSEGNQEEGLLLETCELPTLTSAAWAHVDLFWRLIRFITIFVEALNRCAVSKLSTINQIQISPQEWSHGASV